MSHAEFVDWMAFVKHEPLPAQRADLHAAMQMMLTANINRQKGKRAIKLTQFLPDWWNDKRSPQRLMQKLRALTMGAAGSPLGAGAEEEAAADNENPKRGEQTIDVEHPGNARSQARRERG